MQALGQRDISNAWDLIVLISDYQRTGFINHFHLQPNQCVILRNAIGPHFESLYRDFAELESAKRQPILAYNSTPFRGLSLLPLIFRQFHQAHPETRLQVYSSMKVYQQEEPAEFEALYQTLKQTSGIEYVGSLPQPQLAQALKSSLILTYPNIFAETSCIAVMEAMAAGAFILSSEYGALPETTAGFGELVPVAFTSPEKYVGKFYHALESIYQRALTRREEFLQNLWNQVLHINQNDTWRVRADQWVAMLARELPLK